MHHETVTIFSSCFLGCVCTRVSGNSMTDPIPAESINKDQTTVDPFTSGVIPLEGLLIVPGGFQSYYSIQGQINYTHELVLLDPAPPAPQ